MVISQAARAPGSRQCEQPSPGRAEVPAPGPHLQPEIPLVVAHAMPLEKPDELLLERRGSMMLLLIADIRHQRRLVAGIHREAPVTILPTELGETHVAV